MRKLNVYDDINVTSPLVRLRSVQHAELVLEADFEEAQKLQTLRNPTSINVERYLEKRYISLKKYKENLLEEIYELVGTSPHARDIVHFKDINVESAVREMLDKIDGHIFVEDMLLITEISIEGVSSLEGLQYAKNLKHLSLSWTDLFIDIESDCETAIIFSVLRENLKSLHISNAVFNQYTSLSILHNLEELYLLTNFKNEFDFSMLGLLENVQTLVLSKNLLSERIQVEIQKNPHIKDRIKVVERME